MMVKNRSKKSKRSKVKKPKFVRLVQLWPEKAQHPPSETISGAQKLAVEADEDDDHQNMAYLFSGGDMMSDASITTLLGSAIITSSSTTHHTLLSDDGGAGAELVRTALRKRNGGEESEERWVFYSELVEKRSDQEVSSSCNLTNKITSSIADLKSLALKLDYNQIMDAWADMGPIYTPHHNATYHHILPKDSTSNGLGDEDGVHNTCRVPEMDLNERTSNGSSSSSSSSVKQDEEVIVNSWCWKIEGQREASVRRYKEKRQKRLYAKRIRYQVRKLNAEKRPRLKGRFVKRD